MESYERYYLKNNPFPENPTVEPFSSETGVNQDIRTNGEIFCEPVSKKEMTSLSSKLASRTNLIYVSGCKFEKGTGKSALVVHEWRRLRQNPNTTSTYVKCKRTDKPSDLCGIIISRWHSENYLWNALKKLLSEYSRKSNDLRLTPESVETMFQEYSAPPETVSLALYTHYTSPEALSKNFSKWLSDAKGVSKDVTYYWAYSYLTHPDGILSAFGVSKERKFDRIAVLGDLLSIMTAGGYEQHYIFLDQLEDVIMAVPSGKIGGFCLDLRTMLVKVSGHAVVTCTLHPDSETKLDTPAAEQLTSLAPLNTLHRVDVIELGFQGDEALLLATEYLKRFRTSQPPTDTYPFEPEALRYICYLKQGNKREYLQILHSCLKYGALSGADRISLDFILKNPTDTIGQEIDQEGLKKFKEEGMKNA